MHEQQSTQSIQSKSNLRLSVKQTAPISTEDRRRRVAEAAYFRALRRTFQGGDINDDGYGVEKEIDASLRK